MTDATTRICRGFKPAGIEAHESSNFRNDDIKLCRDCDREYRRDYAARRKAKVAKSTFPVLESATVPVAASAVANDPDAEKVSPAEAASSHEYVPAKELTELWHAVVTGAQRHVPQNLLFVGPSGSGKTDGARYLAALAGLPFTKVDSPSMTDPEAWFGTREIVAENGVAETKYEPSDFVRSITQPGVTLLDEINRVRDEHRNILLGVLDGTREVMNPLTGEVIKRHPQNFVIMSGNVGLAFTGTHAIDPAFMSRSLQVEFEYADEKTEIRILQEATSVSLEDATVLARFAVETRAKAQIDDEFIPVSTRDLIDCGNLIHDGLGRDLAVKFTILNGASSEGGSASLRQEMENIWNGVRVLKVEVERTVSAAPQTPWVCPVHRRVKTVPAGFSAKTGKRYNEFKACPVTTCPHTADKDAAARKGGGSVASGSIGSPKITCKSCGYDAAPGRTTICGNCGGSLR